MTALEARHLKDLTFQEVSRALRALSSTYVERRRKISEGSALAGAGKRAAFALFYGPLHFILINRIVRSLPGALDSRGTLIDLGCGTGAAGAAWAAACTTAPRLLGIDRHPWAVAEAARTYRDFGLDGRVRRADLENAAGEKGAVPLFEKGAVPLFRGPGSIVAAFTINELSSAARDAMLPRLLGHAADGRAILVVEPLAGFVAPWWARWRSAVESAGGRSDEWRFQVELPPLVAKLDRAAGLDHRELTGRSLWLASHSSS